MADLAERLSVAPSQLLPLIEHGYVRIVSSDPPTVYEPPPTAVEWLREMFTPLPLRPLLTIEMVATLENLRPSDVRKLCAVYGIPIRVDPVFGEMFTLSTFQRFHQQMFYYRDPSRFDRQAMLIALVHAASPNRSREKFNAPTYSKRVEREIKRIAKLTEPAKTDAALRLWEAFEDAYEVAKAVAKAKGFRKPTQFNSQNYPIRKTIGRFLKVHEKPPAPPATS